MATTSSQATKTKMKCICKICNLGFVKLWTVFNDEQCF